MKSSPPRAHSRSNATRLLSAGVYLEKVFRKGVIEELVTNQYRVVAPAYGYDVVTVLAHALAARRIQRVQIATAVVGAGFLLFLTSQDAIDSTLTVLLYVVLLWALAFARRVLVMNTLMTRIRPIRETPGTHSTQDDLPANPALTPDLVDKIAREQAAAHDVIYYGGYRPFVGAGTATHNWSMATLLTERGPDPLLTYLKRDRRDRDPRFDEPTGRLVPFTVEEVVSYVGKQLVADLRDNAAPGEGIPQLTVSRQRYSRAGQVPIKRRRWRASQVMRPQTGSSWETDTQVLPPVQDRERYEATREYLCVRIGSWNQEVVTSVFIGFDLRGNTFYSEFYAYLLAPVRADFHLVDQLPEQLTGGLAARVAWDALVSIPTGVKRIALRWLGVAARTWMVAAVKRVDIDTSELRLGRYAVDLVETGAVNSVRELATADDFHHFFQEADTVKYVKIVERRLLATIRGFLKDHNVDLGDYDARQTNILDNSISYGDTNHYGSGDINQSTAQQFIRQSSAPSGQGSR